ncbi:MAG: AmmeMemoRadiSam system protein B [Candidatus Aenigmatarchaeota archaeon]
METRNPVVSGMFYPSDKARLSNQIKELFSKASPSQKYRIVVSPHAGYVYSGLGAAFAVGSLKPAKTFVVLGPNHTGMGQEFSVMTGGVWKTPLGDIEVDSKTASEIVKAGLAEDDDWAHASEHSIEVQLPFLQYRFGSFGFVPVCIMNEGYSESFLKKCASLGNFLGRLMKERDVNIVASSDFSHYIPAKSAKKFDMEAIERVLMLDLKGFFETLKRNRASVCGYGPIAVAMAAAKSLGVKKGELLSYTNSGDVTGDLSSVVAYAAIGLG